MALIRFNENTMTYLSQSYMKTTQKRKVYILAYSSVLTMDKVHNT